MKTGHIKLFTLFVATSLLCGCGASVADSDGLDEIENFWPYAIHAVKNDPVETMVKKLISPDFLSSISAETYQKSLESIELTKTSLLADIEYMKNNIPVHYELRKKMRFDLSASYSVELVFENNRWYFRQ